MLTETEAKDIQINEFMAYSGGFGCIHLGVFRNELVAIKEQKPTKNKPDSIFLAILREIVIFQVCDHPNIAKIFAVYFDPSPSQLSVWTLHPQYYKNLCEVLFGKKKYLIPKKHEICCQILEGIKYFHSLGIIHMDLKPNNIVFKTSAFKKIIILDFGISKLEKQNQEATNIIGFNYYYCPPEAKDNDKSQLSSKSDIFNIGIILYELVTERRAFINYFRQGGIAIYQLIHNTQFNFFNYNQLTGNEQLDKLIGDCVHYDPSMRPTAVDALAKIKMIKL